MIAITLAAPARSQTAPQTPRTPTGDQPATVASLFADFLHFSVLGRFDVADTYAQELINHPDLDPVELLRLSEQHERSVETLMVIIKNSTIGESAARILEIIHEGEHLLRKDTDRIVDSIQGLGGPPQAEYNATRRLADSGEYAIPWMIHTLGDPGKKDLWVRVIRALPKIGRPAVGPLVMALNVDNQDVRRVVVDALGELGYAQAIPYLQMVMTGSQAAPEMRQAAARALERIGRGIGHTPDRSPAVEFVRLAEQFYAEHGSVRADPRLEKANVWYWDADTGFVTAVVVPQGIFGPVMAMRCCESALQIEPGSHEAVALWLTANIRREARLGLDIESDDVSAAEGTDPTRPPGFPRSLYFTSAAGPRFAHQVLGRAITDRDAAVALGAIAAIRRVAGPSSLIGPEDHKRGIVAALQFPDFVVRIRAALAIGNALPHTGFDGSDRVVPVLASAINQTGRRHLLVIDPVQDRLNRRLAELRSPDTDVIGSDHVLAGLRRAGNELGWITAILLSSDVTSPGLADALLAIRSLPELSATPVVLMVQPEQAAIADRIAANDPGVERAEAGAGGQVLLARLETAAARVGQTPLDADLAMELALAAARTLQAMAADGRTVFDVTKAQSSVIAALGSPHEDLQRAAIDVLAMLSTSVAQQAIADVALTDSNPQTLRIAAFVGLAESAKRFGRGLEDAQVKDLIRAAFDEADLQLRTAASHALGALNLTADQASEIIRKYHGG